MTDVEQGAQKVSWDRSRQRELSSTLATARAASNHVVIDFGERVCPDGAETSPRLQRRIVLQPAAAKSLFDMLTRLASESCASADGPGLCP